MRSARGAICFFASVSTNQEALIYNLANGGKERKGRTITAPDRAVA